MKQLNRLYSREQRLYPRLKVAACPCAAESLLCLCRVQRVAIESVTFRLLEPVGMQAKLAELLTSCTLLSVRDGNTIVLRLQCARTRCGRKGLAGRSNVRLGHLFWNGKNVQT